MAKALEITENFDGGTHTLVLSGRLDATTSPAFDSTTKRLFAVEPEAHVVVDMAECEFVSSAGLRVIIALQKRASVGGSLVFTHVSPDIMEVLAATGFSDVLTFE